MRRVGLLVAVMVFVLAGCGGSSTTAGTTTTAGAGAGAASTSSTAPSFSGSRDSKYCNLARQFSQTLNVSPTGDPKALFQQFDSLAAQFLAAVPSAIKPDAQTVIDAIRQLEATVKAANYDFTKLKPTDLAPVQDPKFTAATNRIDAYDTQVCGITTSST